MNIVKVPQLAWYQTKELELPLPDSWQAEIYNMAGYDRKLLQKSHGTDTKVAVYPDAEIQYCV